MKKISLPIALLLLSACADLEIHSPLPTVEPPLTVGKKGQLAVDGGVQQNARLVVTDDASARPPNLTGQRGSQSGSVFGGAIMGLSERLDLGARLALPGILRFRALWQILGEGRSARKPGDWSFGVFSSLSYSQRKESGDQDGLFGPGGNPWEAEVKSSAFDGGFSVGYQWGEKTALFTGFAVGTYKGEFEIDQKATNSDPGGVYSDSFNGHAHTVSLGATFGQETILALVGSYHESQLAGTNEEYGVSLTGSVTVNVGK